MAAPRRSIARRTTRASRTTSPRRRRPPEQARREILDAAERVFTEHQPDQVGLKQVAREAGVSHALITHYFGTYAGLIEAALERRLRAVRERTLERLREAGVLGRSSELLRILFKTLEDPVHLRLTRWLLASERPAAAHVSGLQDRGLQLIAHQIARAFDPSATAAVISRVEILLLTAVSAVYGYTLGKHALLGALGREVTSELDEQFIDTLARMVHVTIRSELGEPVRRTDP